MNQYIRASNGRRPVIAVLAVILGAAVAMRQIGPVAHAQIASPADHFKYGSVGIEENQGLPYWIWQVLPIIAPHRRPPLYALPPHAREAGPIEVWSEHAPRGRRGRRPELPGVLRWIT